MKRANVALLADYLKEGWPSMDLVAEMYASHLPGPLDAASMGLQLLRPAMRQRFSKLPCLGHNRAKRAAWRLDRLTNRFYDYPRFLRAERGKFDLFHLADHSYSQLLHELPPGRAVVTCHDLDTFRCLWEPERERRGRAFVAMTQRILSGMQKAAHVCCDSESTREELLMRGLMPGARVSVVRLGLRPEITAELDPVAKATIEKLLAVDSSVEPLDLLHVGSTIARKRIDVLLEVCSRVKRIEPRLRLLRVGGAFTVEQKARIERLGLGNSICVLPFLSPLELAAVYRRAVMVLMPSEAEGFGLPVIEAQASGVPVLASDLPVLREVGGDAAAYAPVGDVEVWEIQMKELLRERAQDSAAWEIRREKARRQAAKFSWVSAAQEMTKIYLKVLAAAA